MKCYVQNGAGVFSDLVYSRNKIASEQERVKKFRKECGNVKIGEITVDMVGHFILYLDAQDFAH